MCIREKVTVSVCVVFTVSNMVNCLCLYEYGLLFDAKFGFKQAKLLGTEFTIKWVLVFMTLKFTFFQM